MINPLDIPGFGAARCFATVVFAALVALGTLVVATAGASRDASAAQPVSAGRTVERELIFGSELMTDAELDRYRDEVNKLNNETARAQYRERHRQRLRERARNRGVELQEPAGTLRRKDSR